MTWAASPRSSRRLAPKRRAMARRRADRPGGGDSRAMRPSARPTRRSTSISASSGPPPRSAGTSDCRSVQTIDERCPSGPPGGSAAPRRGRRAGKLDRPALVVALVRHRRVDDAGLRIGPADPADAGGLAQARSAPSAATTRSARIRLPSAGARRSRRSPAPPRDRARLQHHAGRVRRVAQRPQPGRRPRPCGEGLSFRHSPSKVRKVGRTGSASRLSVMTIS